MTNLLPYNPMATKCFIKNMFKDANDKGIKNMFSEILTYELWEMAYLVLTDKRINKFAPDLIKIYNAYYCAILTNQN